MILSLARFAKAINTLLGMALNIAPNAVQK
jgi:hypothetical protein